MAKKIFAIKRTSKFERFRWIILTCALGVITISVVFFWYQYKKNPFIANYFSKIETWVVARKAHIHHGLVKVKQLAENKNPSEPNVRFEFYNTLPNMTVPVSIEQNVKPQSTKVISKNSKRKNSLLKKTFTAEKLEQDLSQHFAEKKGKKI